MQTAWHIGITGGMGSGKSTVAKILAQANTYVIDADQIAHASTSSHGAAIESIRRTFGEDYIDAQGSMRRDAMRELVFQDAKAKQQLEAIVHPIVQQQILKQAQAATQTNTRLIVYDLPLLAESPHWRKRLHSVWVVECDTETQIQRCMQRSQLKRSQVEAILQQQASHTQRRNIADAVIINGADTNIYKLTKQIQALTADFGCIMRAGGEIPSDFVRTPF